jgi:hypothetical protein
MESAGAGRTGRRIGADKSGYPDVGRHMGGDTNWQRREAAKEPRRQTGKQPTRRAWSIIPVGSDRRRRQGAVRPTVVGG